MGTRLLLTVMLLVGLVVLVIPMASPVLGAGSPPGANYNNVQQSVGVIPNATLNNTYVDYYITVANGPSGNPSLIAADATNVAVTFTPSGADGQPDAGQALLIDTIASLPAAVATTVKYGPPGSGLIEKTALHRLISLNPGVLVAHASSHIEGTLLTDPVNSSVTDTKDIPLTIAYPSTTMTMTTTSTQVPPSGGNVTLTIVDRNNGDVPLTTPYVILTDNLGSPPITLDRNNYYVSGDNNPDDGVMDPGESWHWQITIFVDQAVTFTATGHGTAPDGLDVTPANGYPSEQATVQVTLPKRPPSTPTIGQWGMIAMATLLAGSLVWVVRKRQTKSGSPKAE